MQVRKRMLFLIRSLMQLERDMGHNLEGIRIEVMVKDTSSVRYVARITSRGISHHIR